MNRRLKMEGLLDKSGQWDYTPAGFFIHFDDEHRAGRKAVDKHIEYLNYTGMDFLKIQFEQPFPLLDNIKNVNQWDSFPMYGIDYYEESLEVVRALVKEMKKEVLIIVTVYSPFMNTRNSVTDEVLTAHLNEAPEKVVKGFERATESTLLFIKECKKIGVDGFYSSTQGGEGRRFASADIFEKYIKPCDLETMEEMHRGTCFNILHICDFRKPYEEIESFHDYPGQIVSYPAVLADGSRISPREAYRIFERPVMGGLDRLGPISKAPGEALKNEIESVFSEAPERFVLGADCTIPDANWESIRFSIDMAHNR